MSETTETAVVVAPKVPVHVGMRLSSLDEAYRLAQNLAVAAVMPNALRGRPSDVLAIILYGQDLGLSPMQAAMGIYVVEGRPTLSAQTWIALARRAGHEIRRTEYVPDKSCTVYLKRGDTGEDHTETATIEQAVKAGKVTLKDGKPQARSDKGKVLPWEAYTDRMLLARAVSNACRFLCPEIALGFYSEADVEDLREIPDPEIVAPLGAGIEDAEIVDPEDVKDQLDALADQFDFSHAAEQEEISGDDDE